VPRVIFHCNSCSPNGRGPRTAGWYADELETKGLGDKVEGVFVLEGGIKAWKALYGEEKDLTVELPVLST
jgi:arsenical-resistance protein 2